MRALPDPSVLASRRLWVGDAQVDGLTVRRAGVDLNSRKARKHTIGGSTPITVVDGG